MSLLRFSDFLNFYLVFFHKIANKLGVFKVETVGDCNVAVAGLPEPREDNAVIMSWFAYECMIHMRELTKTLESSMGHSTGKLIFASESDCIAGPSLLVSWEAKNRDSNYSGTDMVNTASRMESTEKDDMIQISEATADLQNSAGKSHWMRCREELVSVKGKGEMRTYWVNPIRGLTLDCQKKISV